MTKKTEELSQEEIFTNDLDDFLRKTARIEVNNLSEFDQVPNWIHSGSYALNWIISNDMFLGMPMTKFILISGESECLTGDTELEFQLPKEIADIVDRI